MNRYDARQQFIEGLDRYVAASRRAMGCFASPAGSA
jgi:hypothetical protein